MNIRIIVFSMSCLLLFILQGCKHPLAIVGEGDIVERNSSGRGCTLEQFKAQDIVCTANDVTGDYFVNYKAVPRAGWRFVEWQGPCATKSDFQHCRLQIPAHVLEQWEADHPEDKIPPSIAVFQAISGETGYLLAGTPVAGVTYTTPTQQGVTGLDGSFQYSEGERVRFSIGATTLGELVGKTQVTPYDLAGSPVVTGTKIAWVLRDEENPLNGVINLVVFLQSMDQDANPANGIVITRGVAELLSKVKLPLHQRPSEFAGSNNSEGWNMYVAQGWNDFQDNPTFRHILGKASRERRFSVPHGVVTPAKAMAQLHDALGIDPRIVGMTQRLTQNQDGDSWDRIAYNAAGNLSRHESSVYAGAYETWQYDANGNVTQHEQHASELDHHMVSTWLYDSNNNLTRAETDFSGNNVWSGYQSSASYTYDNDGNRTEEASTRTSEGRTESELSYYSYMHDKYGRLAQYIAESEQQSGDGSSFSSAEYFNYFHDLDGNLRKYSLARDVNEVDGVPEQTWIWWYDPSGNVRKYESISALFFEEDPRPLVWNWAYDDEGKIIRFASISGAWLFRYEYDEDGNTTRRERVNTSSGTVDEVVSWQYNSGGKVELKETFQGVADLPEADTEHSLESWHYHPNGAVSLYALEATHHVSDRGTYFEYTESHEYQYDTNGNLTRYTNGDQIHNWQYDAAGNLSREEVGNGERYVNTWDYDANGNPTRSTFDEGSNGSIDETHAYSYQPAGWGFLFSGVDLFGLPHPLPLQPGDSFEYIPTPPLPTP